MDAEDEEDEALLLPPLFWLALGAAACALTDGVWFWLAMTALLANSGGAADDFYFALCVLRAPGTALVQYRGYAAGIFTEE